MSSFILKDVDNNNRRYPITTWDPAVVIDQPVQRATIRAHAVNNYNSWVEGHEKRRIASLPVQSHPLTTDGVEQRTKFGLNEMNRSNVPPQLPWFFNEFADWGSEFKKPQTPKPASSKPTSYTKRNSSGGSKTGEAAKYCSFCKKNGELPEIYMSHQLTGKNNITTCPILSSCICSECNNRGHTQSYCPSSQRQVSIVRTMSEHDKLYTGQR